MLLTRKDVHPTQLMRVTQDKSITLYNVVRLNLVCYKSVVY